MEESFTKVKLKPNLVNISNTLELNERETRKYLLYLAKRKNTII